MAFTSGKEFPLYPGHILISVGAENTYLGNMNALMSQLHVQYYKYFL